jgi:hypothetical protein
MVPAPFIVVIDANVLFPLTLREQAADLQKPPVMFEELLDRLSRPVPDLVRAVREHLVTGGGS